eukprot:scaffold173663_cov21-Tisochrysis_lutea.AAC.2
MDCRCLDAMYQTESFNALPSSGATMSVSRTSQDYTDALDLKSDACMFEQNLKPCTSQARPSAGQHVHSASKL